MKLADCFKEDSEFACDGPPRIQVVPLTGSHIEGEFESTEMKRVDSLKEAYERVHVHNSGSDIYKHERELNRAPPAFASEWQGYANPSGVGG